MSPMASSSQACASSLLESKEQLESYCSEETTTVVIFGLGSANLTLSSVTAAGPWRRELDLPLERWGQILGA
jgi:hypothetical protein